ncbi:putative nuclease HARBI1 [Centruroides vittatus]|uniref:putative nuclease HARBI1 n=2 Tax=Centruroides vittatus TaxID=120091 RepID=UPI003510999C
MAASVSIDDIVMAGAMTLKYAFLHIFEADSSSSSDEESNESQRRAYVPRIKNYITEIVPLYSSSDFRSHFRLSRASFEALSNLLMPKITNHAINRAGRPSLTACDKVLMTLWFLGNREAYRSVSDRFGVSKSTLFRVVQTTCTALSELAPQFIKWPSGEQVQEITQSFHNKSGFPGVVGAIDGTHIEIPAPQIHAVAYVNRHGYHSIILQAVCDNSMVFISCHAGECGRVHDAEVYARSTLSGKIAREAETMFPYDSHIVGDGAYPINKQLMKPYPDNGHLTATQVRYNNKLSSARSVIERSFAHLKGRWRRLHYLDMSKMESIPSVVMACCVLHNICITRGDILQEENTELEKVH